MKNSIEQKVIMEKLTSGNIVEDEDLFDEFSDLFDNKELKAYLEKIETNFRIIQITAHSTSTREITSTKKSISKIVVFIKKIIRKLLRWYIEPVCEQQTLFNIAVKDIIKEQIKIQYKILQEYKTLTEKLQKQDDFQ